MVRTNASTNGCPVGSTNQADRARELKEKETELITVRREKARDLWRSLEDLF
jgi:hypothetical protein